MNREEAINKWITPAINKVWNDKRCKEILEVLDQEPCEDAISRQAVTDTTICDGISCNECSFNTCEDGQAGCLLKERVDKLPSVTPQPKTDWVPVSERLPDNTDPVHITWVNHDPEPYYADIKDKPFTATGHYCNGRWWWYSVTCQDYLNEYGRCDVDAMDDAIEVTAWMPLPQPYVPDTNIGKMSEIPTGERSDKECTKKR
jgi:hypothetical protein